MNHAIQRKVLYNRLLSNDGIHQENNLKRFESFFGQTSSLNDNSLEVVSRSIDRHCEISIQFGSCVCIVVCPN